MKRAIAVVLVMALSSLIPMRAGFAKTIYESESNIALECVEAIESRLLFFDPVMEELCVYDATTEETQRYPWPVQEWLDQDVQYVRFPSALIGEGRSVLYAIMVLTSFEAGIDGTVLTAELCSLALKESGVEETVIEKLDWDFMIEPEGSGETSRWIYRAIWLEDGLYVHAEKSTEDWSTDSLLVRFQIPGGKAEEIDLKVVLEMEALDDNALLIRKMEGNKPGGRCDLCVYRPGEEPETMIEDFNGRAIAYDGETKTLYYTNGGEVFALTEGKDPEQRANLPFDAPLGARYLEGGYFAAYDYDIAVVQDVREAIQPQTLTIAGTADISEDWEIGFMGENEGVQVKVRNFTPDELVKLLLIQSDAVDLFVVDTSETEVGKTILDRGYVEPITSGTVAETVEQMYPELQEYVSRDGQLYALPYKLMVQRAEAVNMTLFHELGYGDDDLPDTWQEFLDFLKAWEDAGMGKEGVSPILGIEADRAQKMLFGMLVYEYSRLAQRTGTPLDYDDPLFRTWMETLKSIDFDVLGLDPDATEAVFELDHLVSPAAMGGDFVLHSLEVKSRAGTAVPVSLSILMVNPYSQKKELALAFLEYAAQNLDPVYRASMMPDANDPVRPSSYEEDRASIKRDLDEVAQKLSSAEGQQTEALLLQKTSLEESLDFLDEESWLISDESLREYREAVSEMLIPEDYGINDAWSTVEEARDQYFGGAIDLDELIGTLNRVIRMRTLEGD